MKKVWPLLLITIICVSGLFVFGGKDKKTVPVSAVPAKVTDITLTAEASGTVEEKNKAEIYAEEMVTGLLVKEGQEVKKDQPVAKLLSGESIKSPMDGYVKSIPNEQARLASGTTSIMTIGDPSALVLKLTVDEKEIYKFSVGSEASVTCAALPGDSFTGRVSQISPYAKPLATLKDSSAVLDVTIEFTGDTAGIRSGYSADAVIFGSRNENLVMVPFDAVLDQNGEKFVWVQAGKSAELRKVETGLETDFETQIISGVGPEDVIFVNPPWKEGENIAIKQEG